MNIFIHQ